jgi:hypothetical protein
VLRTFPPITDKVDRSEPSPGGYLNDRLTYLPRAVRPKQMGQDCSADSRICPILYDPITFLKMYEIVQHIVCSRRIHLAKGDEEADVKGKAIPTEMVAPWTGVRPDPRGKGNLST